MKIPVAILGATGIVGQKFVELLAFHPWFELVSVAASTRSLHKTYKEAVDWKMISPLPQYIADMSVQACIPNLPCKVVFSALDSSVAKEIEREFALAGYAVISNARNHRMDPSIPLIVPEVNPQHLEIVKQQEFKGGMIVTNPNCMVIGLALAIKPLLDLYGVEKMQVVSLQAVSGAGYPGVASLDIMDNVIPFIADEEEKLEQEPLKIFGSLQAGAFSFYPMSISAQCNRVAVTDGHLACVSVKCKAPSEALAIQQAWQTFQAEPQSLALPTAPTYPLHYFTNPSYPQPRLHRFTEKGGMAVNLGHLRKCPVMDWKFNLLTHNTMRGAAGGSLLIAELMVKKGYI